MDENKEYTDVMRRLVENWKVIIAGQQAKEDRGPLIDRAFELGASYQDVGVATGLDRSSIYRIRHRSRSGQPSEKGAQPGKAKDQQCSMNSRKQPRIM